MPNKAFTPRGLVDISDAPLVVRRAFRLNGRQYAVGAQFNWRNSAVSERRVRQMFNTGQLGLVEGTTTGATGAATEATSAPAATTIAAAPAAPTDGPSPAEDGGTPTATPVPTPAPAPKTPKAKK